MGKLVASLRNQWMGALALFVALGGTAYAVTELERNEVKSKHIGKGQIKNADLAGDAVTSPKVANGSLLGEDFAAGEVPAGPQGEQGPRGEQGEQGLQGVQGPAGSARAFGFVTAAGALSRSKNVTGVAKVATGLYCITLDPSIDAAQAVVFTEEDRSTGNTSDANEDVSVGHFFSNPSGLGCAANSVAVRMFLYRGDEVDNDTGGNTTGDNLVVADDSFAFMVP